MFVFVKFWDSIKLDFFGPTTPGECESWIKIKKLYLVNDDNFSERLLLDTYELRKKRFLK